MIGTIAIQQLTLLIAGMIASWTDISLRKIPNWLSGATLLAGLAFTTYQQGAEGLGWHALHAWAALSVGIALYAVNAIGGGDAKFYAAVAAWFDLNQALSLFVLVSVSGFLLLVVWFSWRMWRGKPVRRRGGGLEGLPYGVAIAAGALILALVG